MHPDDFPKLQPLINATVSALTNLGGSVSNEEIDLLEANI